MLEVGFNEGELLGPLVGSPVGGLDKVALGLTEGDLDGEPLGTCDFSGVGLYEGVSLATALGLHDGVMVVDCDGASDTGLRQSFHPDATTLVFISQVKIVDLKTGRFDGPSLPSSKTISGSPSVSIRRISPATLKSPSVFTIAERETPNVHPANGYTALELLWIHLSSSVSRQTWPISRKITKNASD